MLVKVYADDTLVYDSRLDEYRLLALSVTKGVAISGTASILMPPKHPAYNRFVAFRTVVTIYRGDALIFRGRALPPYDDIHKFRTITCEGERGFFIDAVSRPYVYQDSPAAIFAAVIGVYNSQVEAFKQFKVGTVTVTDPNDYVRLESNAAEQIADTVNKLVERCGGYIVFSTDADGARVVNWYETIGTRCNQPIQFGENLLDYARTDNSDDLATVIIPYGGIDEATGQRITIESVNNGLDFIQDDEAVALRGVIIKPVYWDDVLIPANLLIKAHQYLAKAKLIITSLELTAVDLSAKDQNIDSFREGDTVPVISPPHELDDDFQVRTRTYDLLNPDNDLIAMGKEITTLTGSDAAGDKKASTALQRVERNMKADYKLNTDKAIQQTMTTLSALIQQTAEAIKLEVSKTYATDESVAKVVKSSMEQLSDSFHFQFTELQRIVDSNNADVNGQFQLIEKYIRFVGGDIVLGESSNELILRLQNDRISFIDGGAEVAYFSNKQLVVLDGHFLNSLRIGSFAFVPRENGNLSLTKVGG